MTEQETFNEWVKQLEPSMAVPLYPKALLLDFMKKSFFAGLKQHEHDYLVKTNDLKANFGYVLEGKDLEIKEKDRQLNNWYLEWQKQKKKIKRLGKRCNQLLKDKGDLTDKVQKLETERKKLCDEFEDMKAGLESQIAQLEQQIEKMKNCGNCKYGYCGGSSISIDKDGNRTFHNWNKEKQVYCDIGKNGKYQCWEIKEDE